MKISQVILLISVFLLVSLSISAKVVTNAQEAYIGANSKSNSTNNNKDSAKSSNLTNHDNSIQCRTLCPQLGQICVKSKGNVITCQTNCGDGLKAGKEQCDDGNTIENDGCFNCVIEQGWGCQTRTGEPSRCQTICGDGLIRGAEQCDDANSIEGDGCSQCNLEHGWGCQGQPSVCQFLCGNRKWDEGEQCEYTFMMACNLNCRINKALLQACNDYDPHLNPPPYYHPQANQTFVCADKYGFGCNNCLKISQKSNYKCQFHEQPPSYYQLSQDKISQYIYGFYYCTLTCPPTSLIEQIDTNLSFQLIMSLFVYAAQTYKENSHFLKVYQNVTVQQMLALFKANNLEKQIDYMNLISDETIDLTSNDTSYTVKSLIDIFIDEGSRLSTQSVTISSDGPHIFTIYYIEQQGSYIDHLAYQTNNNIAYEFVRNLPQSNLSIQMLQIFSCINFRFVPVNPSKTV